MKAHEKRVYLNHIRRLRTQNRLLLEVLERERACRIMEKQRNRKILESPIRKFMATLEASVCYYLQNVDDFDEKTSKNTENQGKNL